MSRIDEQLATNVFTSGSSFARLTVVLAALLLGGCGSGPASSAQSGPGVPQKAALGSASAAGQGLVASAQAQTQANQPSVSADWQGEWERTLTAAKKEGKLVMDGLTGDVRRETLTAMQRVYPDIQIDYSGIADRDFVPRLNAERDAGRYLWDIWVGGAPALVRNFGPAGIVEPLRPNLIRPEIYDDSKWLNGFEWGFLDKAKRAFATGAYKQVLVRVNRDLVPQSQLSKVDDLLKPELKGKIAWDDPREEGTGNTHLARFLGSKGEAWSRKVLSEQGVVATRDKRQLAEWLVRGRYPIAVGIDDSILEEFVGQGVGKNVLAVQGNDNVGVAVYPAIAIFNRAPHPNAAKVYADWFLSRDGQALWNKNNPFNSRRLDVPAAREDQKLEAGADYFVVGREENVEFPARAAALARDAIK